MIYTTYFGKLKDLPKNIIPVSIAGIKPTGLNILEYKRLAPTYRMFAEWRVSKRMGRDEEYVERFNRTILDNLHPSIVVCELHRICGHSMFDNIDIALVCYEKPENFCHRHLVAKWLNDNGFPCKEYEYARGE